MNKKIHIKAWDRFICRVPLLSLNPLSDAATNGQAINDHKILEAIMVASFDLSEQINAIRRDEKFSQTKEFIAFFKYFSRMSTRCTPFGLFASTSVGTVSNITKFNIPDTIFRKTRLDMYFVCMLIQHISLDNEFKTKLKYFPNNTIYEAGDTCRYIMFEYKEGRRNHFISEFDKSGEVSVLLAKMTDGLLYNDMICVLTKLGFSELEASSYINSLIDYQVIINELNPSVVGVDSFEKVISIISKLPLSAQNSIFRDSIIHINELLKEIDTVSDPEERISIYKHIISASSRLNIPFNSNQLIQVDTSHRSNSVSIGYDIVKQLKHAIKFFLNFLELVMPNDLRKFSSEFHNKYESAEIPLSIALDSDIGIGYPPQNGNANISPIIDNLNLYHTEESQDSISINKFQAAILTDMLKSQGDVCKDVALDNVDFEHHKINLDNIKTINICFQIFHTANGQEQIYIKGINANNSGKILSRFAHLDKDIYKLVLDLSKEEFVDNKIVAEVVHLPSSRVGNILCRPHISDYEIVYLSDSDIKPSNKIGMSDIMISIKNNRICLRSKKHNKEIIPQLTSAHNYHLDTLPTYKFLCDMQYSSGANVFTCTTDSLLSFLRFTPRVTYKNIVISLAKWKIAVADIMQFSVLPHNEMIVGISEWRLVNNIPICALLQNGDNELYVNFSNGFSLDGVFSVIKTQKIIVLSEFIFHDEKENQYANECLMTFKISQI